MIDYILRFHIAEVCLWQICIDDKQENSDYFYQYK